MTAPFVSLHANESFPLIPKTNSVSFTETQQRGAGEGGDMLSEERQGYSVVMPGPVALPEEGGKWFGTNNKKPRKGWKKKEWLKSCFKQNTRKGTVSEGSQEARQGRAEV